MSNTELAAIDPATLARRKPATLKPTPKVAEAIRLMIEEGIDYATAGNRVGLNARAMRVALEKPHVISHMKRAREVFRGAVSARNILRLAEIRDAANNMPAVQAIRMLEQIDENAPVSNGLPRTPGVVIVVKGDAQISSGPVADEAEKGSVSD